MAAASTVAAPEQAMRQLLRSRLHTDFTLLALTHSDDRHAKTLPGNNVLQEEQMHSQAEPQIATHVLDCYLQQAMQTNVLSQDAK